MDRIDKLQRRAMQAKGIGTGEALELVMAGAERPWRVLAAAAEIREFFKGREIVLCGIVNAKSGKCSEDCAFCAQSSHYRTEAPTYPLKGAAAIVEEAEAARRCGAEFFGIVTSGKRIKGKKEWATLLKAIEGVRRVGLNPCASLGMIDAVQAGELKAAGLERYHHNLETGRSYFPRICTTHDYEEDVQTCRIAKAAGLSVCAGGSSAWRGYKPPYRTGGDPAGAGCRFGAHQHPQPHPGDAPGPGHAAAAPGDPHDRRRFPLHAAG